MTDSTYTHISYLLDRSGSMYEIWNDAVGGYTQFIETQKAVPGKATFSLAAFDTGYIPVYEFANLQDIPSTFPESIVPNGGTALIDAAVRLITATGAKLAALPEDERPSKVIVVMYTDGEENASREYTRHQLRTLIEEQTTKYSWDFIFLASNIDTTAAAVSYGINVATTSSVHQNNLHDANVLTTNKIASYRSSGDKGVLTYTAAEVQSLAQDPNTTNGPVS